MEPLPPLLPAVSLGIDSARRSDAPRHHHTDQYGSTNLHFDGFRIGSTHTPCVAVSTTWTLHVTEVTHQRFLRGLRTIGGHFRVFKDHSNSYARADLTEGSGAMLA